MRKTVHARYVSTCEAGQAEDNARRCANDVFDKMSAIRPTSRTRPNRPEHEERSRLSGENGCGGGEAGNAWRGEDARAKVRRAVVHAQKVEANDAAGGSRPARDVRRGVMQRPRAAARVRSVRRAATGNGRGAYRRACEQPHAVPTLSRARQASCRIVYARRDAQPLF